MRKSESQYVEGKIVYFEQIVVRKKSSQLPASEKFYRNLPVASYVINDQKFTVVLPLDKDGRSYNIGDPVILELSKTTGALLSVDGKKESGFSLLLIVMLLIALAFFFANKFRLISGKYPSSSAT